MANNLRGQFDIKLCDTTLRCKFNHNFIARMESELDVGFRGYTAQLLYDSNEKYRDIAKILFIAAEENGDTRHSVDEILELMFDHGVTKVAPMLHDPFLRAILGLEDYKEYIENKEKGEIEPLGKSLDKDEETTQ